MLEGANFTDVPSKSSQTLLWNPERWLEASHSGPLKGLNGQYVLECDFEQETFIASLLLAEMLTHHSLYNLADSVSAQSIRPIQAL